MSDYETLFFLERQEAFWKGRKLSGKSRKLSGKAGSFLEKASLYIWRELLFRIFDMSLDFFYMFSDFGSGGGPTNQSLGTMRRRAFEFGQTPDQICAQEKISA